MTSHVIESIGKWGVKSTPIRHRLAQVKPGDAISIEHLTAYPFLNRSWATVSDVDKKTGRVSMCIGSCSTFINEDGSVSISGGPFHGCDIAELVPMYVLRPQTFWNWGDNFPGAQQGVEYIVPRPVFTLEPKESINEG